MTLFAEFLYFSMKYIALFWLGTGRGCPSGKDLPPLQETVGNTFVTPQIFSYGTFNVGALPKIYMQHTRHVYLFLVDRLDISA